MNTQNKLLEKVAQLDQIELDAFKAILEAYGDDVEEALNILKTGDYSYYPNVYDYSECL